MIHLYLTIDFAGNKMQKLLVSSKVQVLQLLCQPSASLFNGHVAILWLLGYFNTLAAGLRYIRTSISA